MALSGVCMKVLTLMKEEKMMKNIALMLLAVSSLTLMACDDQKTKTESSQKSEVEGGTTMERVTTTETKTDDSGNAKQETETKTTTDPQGLMNKETTTEKTTQSTETK